MKLVAFLSLFFFTLTGSTAWAGDSAGSTAADNSCRANFIGDVDSASVLMLLEQVLELSASCEQVVLFIDSMGGDVSPGMFLLHDLTAINLKTVVLSEAGPMATALFMAGDERIMSPDAELYLRTDSMEVPRVFPINSGILLIEYTGRKSSMSSSSRSRLV